MNGNYSGLVINCYDEVVFKSKIMQKPEDVVDWGRVKICKLFARRNAHPTILLDANQLVIYRNHAARRYKDILQKIKEIKNSNPPTWSFRKETLEGEITLISFNKSLISD